MQDEDIYVQVRSQALAVSPQGAEDSFSKLTPERMDQIARIVSKSGGELVKKLRSEPGAPDEISLEFGVDVSAEGSVPFITKGSIGANFKISVGWRRQGDGK